jgi:hypothetical protein
MERGRDCGGGRRRAALTALRWRGERAQPYVLLVLGERVRSTQQHLQDPGRAELLHGSGGDREARPVTAELAVRVGGEPVQRHVAMHTPPGQFADLSVVEERVHDGQEVGGNGGLPASEGDPPDWRPRWRRC